MANFGTLEADLLVSLRDVRLSARDRTTGELAKRYARLIDNAAPAAKYRAHLSALGRALAMLAETEPLAAAEAAEHFDKIADALSAHSVASDLGPKLLAALTALGMTPAARGAKDGGSTGGSSSGGSSAAKPAQPETTLEKLRRERAEQRARGARERGA